ncbi:MAG: hypothetical protein RSC96_08740 [Oscillospiraceae bacterium]
MENANLKNTIYDIDKLISLQENRILEIDGEQYSEKELTRIPKMAESEHPKNIGVHSLQALCSLIKTEIDAHVSPVFIEVVDYRNVRAFTTYRNDFKRDAIYDVTCDTPRFDWGHYLNHESAIIAIMSRFIQNSDTEYMLKLLSSITVNNAVTSNDNGVTQQVEARSGVSLKQKVTVKPFVKIAPYRTFLEVEQPESTMLLRVNDDAEILLVEADGGMWQLEAKARIKTYLEEQLKTLIDCEKVIVIA